MSRAWQAAASSSPMSVRARSRVTSSAPSRAASRSSDSSPASDTIAVTPHCRAAATAASRGAARACRRRRGRRRRATGKMTQHVRLAAQIPWRRVRWRNCSLPGRPVAVCGGGNVDRPGNRAQQGVDVVRPAGLRRAADRRALPPAERLALDDRPGDVPVDVGVADLDVLQPVADLVVVERLDAAGEPERGAVLQAHGVGQVVGPHHAEHRPEALGLVEPRALGDADADTRRPAPAGDRPSPRIVARDGVSPVARVARRASARPGRAPSAHAAADPTAGRSTAPSSSPGRRPRRHARCARQRRAAAGTRRRRTPGR